MNPARRLSRCAMLRRTELIPFYSRFAAQSSLVAISKASPLPTAHFGHLRLARKSIVFGHHFG
jgi:hypothetical protein